MNALAGIQDLSQKALGLNMDSTNGHEVEANMAREDLVQRMFQAREAGDEATARRYDQAILDSDRINLAAQERESEFIANRNVGKPT